MDKEVVVTRNLTNEMIDAGAKLTRELDKFGLKVTSSFWWHMPESGTWRLIIASPQVKKEGLRKVYQRIQGVLSKMPADQPTVALKDIDVVGETDPTVSALRSGFKTPADAISGVSVTASAIRGRYVYDAFIYRNT